MKTLKNTHIIDKVYKDSLSACQEENQKLIEALKIYGYRPWKELSLTDRGDKARKLLKELVGLNGGKK